MLAKVTTDLRSVPMEAITG